jgi:hypothetical protein
VGRGGAGRGRGRIGRLPQPGTRVAAAGHGSGISPRPRQERRARGEAAGPAVGAFPACASVKHSRRSLLAASSLEGASEPRNDATEAKRTDPPRRSTVRVEEDRRREALLP